MTTPPPAAGPPPDNGRESGRITVLVCGLLVLVLMVIAVTSTITHVALAQRRLMAAADGAAAVASERFALAEGQGEDPAVQLSVRQAREDAAEYLSQLGALPTLSGVRIEEVRLVDGGEGLEVRLSGATRLPWGLSVLGGSATVEARGQSRLGLTR